MSRIALYPGSFDPITNGHIDIVKRATNLFDKVIIGVAKNSTKTALFTVEERVKSIQQVTKGIANISVECFDGLLIDAISQYNVTAIVRGMRSISDYEYESQMAIMNRELNHNYETIFLMPSPKYSFVSSRMIREIASYKGDITPFIPSILVEKVIERASKGFKCP